MTILLIGAIIIAWYVVFFIFLAEGIIVVGTISQKTIGFKNNFEKSGYKIIHADDFRNKGYGYKRAGFIAFANFLLYFFLLKKVVLITSKPFFLKLSFLDSSLIIKNLQVGRSENIEWAKNLSISEALEYIPLYFNKDHEYKFKKKFYITHLESRKALNLISIFIKELEKYPDDRFLKKKKDLIFGHLGTIIS